MLPFHEQFNGLNLPQEGLKIQEEKDFSFGSSE